MASGRDTNLGAALLLGASAQWTHVGALLRRFGYEVHALAGFPGAPQLADIERQEVRLVILDEATFAASGLDVVTLLLGMLSLATILVVRRAASDDDAAAARSERCRYLAPSFSPLDLTQAIVGGLQRRVQRAN
jgi:DNA-binding response OmpR family regulator